MEKNEDTFMVHSISPHLRSWSETTNRFEEGRDAGMTKYIKHAFMYTKLHQCQKRKCRFGEMTPR